MFPILLSPVREFEPCFPLPGVSTGHSGAGVGGGGTSAGLLEGARLHLQHFPPNSCFTFPSVLERVKCVPGECPPESGGAKSPGCGILTEMKENIT